MKDMYRDVEEDEQQDPSLTVHTYPPPSYARALLLQASIRRLHRLGCQINGVHHQLRELQRCQQHRPLSLPLPMPPPLTRCKRSAGALRVASRT
jgi:hypothetical protein